jgi:hypothetical protein
MCAVRSFWGESRTPRSFWQKSPESVENKGMGCYKECAKVQNAENTQLDAESELKIERSGFFGIFDVILQTYVVVASPSIVGDMNKRPLSKSEARILQQYWKLGTTELERVRLVMKDSQVVRNDVASH